MKCKLLNENAGRRTFAVVLRTGDEVMTELQSFAETERITAAQLTAIGAFSEADLAYFDWEQKDYCRIPVREQVEVASLLGDIALSPDGKPALHLHAVLGRRNGSALAGHLAQAKVRPTLEVIVDETPAHLKKRFDPETRLALIDPTAQ
jgi:predicted DNA-binding protein with PD1-like motif